MSLDSNPEAQSTLTPSEPSNPNPNPPQPQKRKRRRRRSYSPKAAQASRLNGAKSQGPTTPEGKANRNRAHLIHGAFSHSDLILPEDRARYEAIFNDFIQRFRPTDHVQLEFIEQMVSASWRRRRHAAILQQYWNDAITEVAKDPSSKDLSPVSLAAKAHARLLNENAPILALEVAEMRESRKFQNAMRCLRDDEKWREKLKLTIDPGNS